MLRTAPLAAAHSAMLSDRVMQVFTDDTIAPLFGVCMPYLYPIQTVQGRTRHSTHYQIAGTAIAVTRARLATHPSNW
jgi:hypothetical protein